MIKEGAKRRSNASRGSDQEGTVLSENEEEEEKQFTFFKHENHNNFNKPKLKASSNVGGNSRQ